MLERGGLEYPCIPDILTDAIGVESGTVTLLDVVRERERILSRIRAAKIGVGANKRGWYAPSHRLAGKVVRKKAEWALKLEKAKADLKSFDAQLAKIEIGEWEGGT